MIVDSRTTFTVCPKPVYLADIWDELVAFHSKIIHRVVEDLEFRLRSRTWDHEDYMRNALLNDFIPGLIDTPQQAHEEDVNIDGVPNPETLVVLPNPISCLA